MQSANPSQIKQNAAGGQGVLWASGGKLFQKTPSPLDKACKRFHVRMLWVVAFMCFASFAIGYRLMGFGTLPEKPQLAQNTNIPAPARPDIVDRHGQLLATNLQASSVYADARSIKDPTDAAKKLAAIFEDLSAESLRHQLASKRSFIWIKRNITPNEQYQVVALGIPGVHFLTEEKRVYPHKELFAHLVGYVDVDNKGQAGIERTLDDWLRSPEMLHHSDDTLLHLSVDMRIQHALHDILREGMETYRAKGAVGLVMDAYTGEVLAMNSLPDFNPNLVTDSPEDNRFNRASLGVYEMGSAFKTFTLAMAIDKGAVNLKEQFDVSKPVRYGKHSISDFRQKMGIMNVAQILGQSSNIGTVQIVERIGGNVFVEYMQKLGMFDRVDFELPERGKPKYPKQFSGVSLATSSYGHGISVTPIHMVRAMAAVVNGGRLIPVSMLKASNDALPVGEPVFHPETSRIMRGLLRGVVSQGTASKAKLTGYNIGGKTGTAEMVSGKGYDKKRKRTNFISAFPMDDPKYVTFIMLEEPQPTADSHGFATAGNNAVPLTAKLISRIGPILGIAPSGIDDTDMPSPPIAKRGLQSVGYKP